MTFFCCLIDSVFSRFFRKIDYRICGCWKKFDMSTMQTSYKTLQAQKRCIVDLKLSLKNFGQRNTLWYFIIQKLNWLINYSSIGCFYCWLWTGKCLLGFVTVAQQTAWNNTLSPTPMGRLEKFLVSKKSYMRNWGLFSSNGGGGLQRGPCWNSLLRWS